jgi:hypothetical protein
MTRQSLFQKIVLFCLLFAVLVLLLLFSPRAAAQCSPPECYPEEPPYEPPPSGGGGAGGGSWSGYSDGRLNPAMDEYYTVYCQNHFLEVWGGVPSPQLISLIPLFDVVNLSDGGSLDGGNGLTVSLNGNVVTVSGSNGNGAGPGSKSFVLDDCVNRNGGFPPAPPDQAPGPIEQPLNPAPEENLPDEAARRLEAEEEIDFCFDSLEFFDDLWIFVSCLNTTLEDYRDVLSGSEIISLVLMVFCLNIIVGMGILPIGIVLFLRWHRGWLRKQKTLG